MIGESPKDLKVLSIVKKGEVPNKTNVVVMMHKKRVITNKINKQPSCFIEKNPHEKIVVSPTKKGNKKITAKIKIPG